MNLVRSFVFCITFLTAAAAADAPVGSIPLQTELKVSGPLVFIGAPLGFRYRPGHVFPLHVYVTNPGPEFRGELRVIEGNGGSENNSENSFGNLAGAQLPGGSFSEAVSFPSGTTTQRVFSFPICAGAISANLTVVIREIDPSGNMGPLRFRASLSRMLKPIAPEGRVVVTCGAQSSILPLKGPHESVQIAARDFPTDSWMYDSIDLIILSDASLKNMPQAAIHAMRVWLLGGGRLLVASSEALPLAIGAGLLPLNAEKVRWIGADRAWWEKNAGLKSEDILASKNNRPVYARLKFGFGQIVFLFPASSLEDAMELGPGIVNHPALRRERVKLPDFRVQPDAYDAFVSGAANSARRGTSVTWIAWGAIMFCAMLALAFSSRSRLVAAGWPLAVGALLSVMLAHWFPPPDLIISRIEYEQCSPDGRASVRNEWALAEVFHDSALLSATGPSLSPLYADSDELKDSNVELNLSTLNNESEQTAGRLTVRNLLVSPSASVLLYASAVTQVEGTGAHEISILAPPLSDPSQKTVHIQIDASQIALPPNILHQKGVLWARLNQSLWSISNFANPAGSDASKLDDPSALLREVLNIRDESLLKARLTALNWAMRKAYQSETETLIFFGEEPESFSPLVEFENTKTKEIGSTFVLYSIPITVNLQK